MRRADIQGLRGVAVTLVVAFHAGLSVSGGFVGVDVFFVISGFVITAMLLPDLEARHRIDFVDFYSRRVKRLLPALAVVLLAVVIAGVALLSPLGSQQQASKTATATSLFAANAQLFLTPIGYFDPRSVTNPLLHTWSLSAEEQFYLFFPAFLVVSWRVGRRYARRWSPRVTAGVLLSALAVASFALSAVMTKVNAKFAFYASPTRAWEFAVGGLLALAVPALERVDRRLAIGAGAVGLALVWISATTITEATPFPGTAALLPVVAAALLVAAGTVTGQGATWLLARKPIVWLGDVSYGWYLWHWPAIVFAQLLWPTGNAATWTVVAIASLAPTWLSYHLVENPIRHNTGLSGRRLVALGGACLLVPLVTSLSLWKTASVVQGVASIKDIQEQAALHADVVRGCNSKVPLTERNDPACTWRVANPRGTVILIGDSNAGQFTEGAARAANQEGFDFTVATFAGCPFADLRFEYGNPDDPADCRHFVTASVAELQQLKPSLVIIASASDELIDAGSPYGFGDPAGGAFVTSPDARARLWQQGSAATLRDLTGAGVHTVLVHPVPHFDAFDLETCPAFRLYTDAESCGARISRGAVDDRHRLALTAEQQALADLPNAVGVDFTNDLCAPQDCSTNDGGEWIYRDRSHLSVGGALRLTDHFAELIRQDV